MTQVSIAERGRPFAVILLSCWVWLLPVAAGAADGDLSKTEPLFRLERRPVPHDAGAELLTVFGPLATSEAAIDVPLVSVLRDTLGDDNTENNRLRYVWVLTSRRPGLLSRSVAALPFFYRRSSIGKPEDGRPSPVLDLSRTSRDVWAAIAGSLAQVLAFDPNGAVVRTVTRTYRGNVLDRRRSDLTEGLAVLSQLQDAPGARNVLSESERLEIETRLVLARQTLGGLVDPERLPEAYYRQRSRAEQTRAHNWELLRQRAEANGLYFEPLGLGPSKTHALLWVAREDLSDPPDRFDTQFLSISDPYTDPQVAGWSGFTSRHVLDSCAKELIPLALYSLEYPKVPLLLVDFRAPGTPKRRELIRRATEDVIRGVMGVSKWGNWPYLVGSSVVEFVRTRHGATNNGDARLTAYRQTRRWLALDSSLDPEIRTEIQQKLEALGLNPLDESVFEEADIARRQYAALLRYADDPNGLAARLHEDRVGELTAYAHGWKARAGFEMAQLFTFGAVRHQDASKTASDQTSLLTSLDRERRAARELRVLDSIPGSTSPTTGGPSVAHARRELDQLVAAGLQGRSSRMAERVLRQMANGDGRTTYQPSTLPAELALHP